MTDQEKIQEEFERWWDDYCCIPDFNDGFEDSSVKKAFFAGYIRGQREAIMQYLADDAQRYGDYEV